MESKQNQEDTEFNEFFNDLLKDVFKQKENIELTDEQVAEILAKLNKFLYQSSKDIGTVKVFGNEYPHISKFHKYWEKNHDKILNFTIDNEKCKKVADILEKIHKKYGEPFKVSHDVGQLTKSQIANSRFFTIIQDFKIKIKEPYSSALKMPHLVDAKEILKNPNYIDRLINDLGADSQFDKRRKFAKNCAELLVEDYDGDAYNILKKHNGDVIKIIDALSNNPKGKFKGQLGFSSKKAIIFIRDLVDLDVWEIKDPENLELPSDVNTMRIALRTGILKTRIPLLASYLDVYCYQYGATDKAARDAWTEVWREWKKIKNNSCVLAPAFFDFFVYRLGQNCCRPKVRRCEQSCNNTKLKSCNLKNLFLKECFGICIFKNVCEETNRKLNPPKSISIMGRTGWESGRIDEGGGGGIMS